MSNTQQPPSLKEDRSHISQSFRCAYYVASLTETHFLVSPHWHDEIEIIYFQNGRFTLEIDMERYEIDSECLFFINSGELHRISSEGPCRESALVFSPYLLSFISNDSAQSKLIGPLTQNDLRLPRQLFPDQEAYADVLGEYRKLSRFCSVSPGPEPDETQQLFIKAALLNILGYLSRNQLLRTAKVPRNESVESIKKVLSYIHAHCGEKIFVRDLAGLLNLNEQYFCRFFKKAIGQSSIAYVNECRIRRAAELLQNTSLAVTDVCMECGFNNLGNFIREFRKQTGVTPLQYRKAAGAGQKSREDG